MLVAMALKKKQVDKENASVVKRDEYTKVLNAIIAGGFCPFCEEHLAKHHTKPILYTTKHWLVTKNAWPYTGARFHFLFISREHLGATEDLSPAAWRDLHTLYRKIVAGNAIKGATLVMRSGETKITGASVHHLHAHLIVGSPRTKTTTPIKALVGFSKK